MTQVDQSYINILRAMTKIDMQKRSKYVKNLAKHIFLHSGRAKYSMIRP